MKLKKILKLISFFGLLAVFWAALVQCPSARANVYATNIKLNDGITNITTTAGEDVKISYILNEPASAGLKIAISSTAGMVRQISLAGGDVGTDRGANSVIWDGLGNNSNTIPSGNYQVQITASSSGYTNWTVITSEDDPGTSVWFGRGIAIDQSSASPYYGRVFVANAAAGPSPDSNPGDIVGILKLNSDASYAEDGASSGGQDGHNWSGEQISPWQAETSGDFLYVSDLAENGQVYRWTAPVSSNSLFSVLRSDNIPGGAQLSGPAIFATGVSTQIWMADTNGSNGILRWQLASSGACATNDLGTTVVALGTDLTNNLTLPPVAVAVSGPSQIFTCQFIETPGDPSSRVFRFTTSGGGPAVTQADWAVGANDDTYTGASDVSVDPTGTYVAVAFQGHEVGGLFQDGNTKVLYATNGALVANLDLGLAINGDATHQDTACGWDAVGNVYCVDNWFGKWRAFSPPGANQATTIAPATIDITGGSSGGGPPPTITGITVNGSTVTIDFTGVASDTPASFATLGAAAVTGPYTAIPNANITQTGSGSFRTTFSNTANMGYFRIQRVGGGTTPGGESPLITSLVVGNGTVTLSFTGSTSDSASQFTLLSSANVAAAFTPTAGANISQVTPGVFRATAPATSAIQFYRLQR
jgi:hypothetical protein